jgi:hypothetical protein
MKSLLLAFGLVLACVAPVLAADQAPDAFVKDLYTAHMPSVDGKGAGVLADDKLRTRFFAPDLAAAIKKDFDDSAKADEVGAIDFDPITDSQDPVVKELKFDVVSSATDKAQVKASFNRGEAKRAEIFYDLVRQAGQWHVSNVSTKGAADEAWSLRELLSMK